MKTLFDVLKGIIESDYEAEILSDENQVVAYAEASGMKIVFSDAQDIITARKLWIEEAEGGEWSHAEFCAKKRLESYVHTVSGCVASRISWKDSFDSMDVESWFGKPAEECEGLNWLEDQPYLVESEWNGFEWVEA